MSPTPANTTHTTVNRQQATRFVSELIVSHRNIQTYPQDHPVVTSTLQKAVDTLGPLIAGGRYFSLGISKQGILLENEVLNPELARFREYADLLSSFGITVITFCDGLLAQELFSFSNIINRPRNEVWEEGGIKKFCADAGIAGIKLQVIDPSVFIYTDDLEADYNSDPWEIFVRKLLAGYFSISHEQLMMLITSSPLELASEFSEIMKDIPEQASQQVLNSMAGYFTAMAERFDGGVLREELIGKMAGFIAGMPPDLRGSFILNICRSSESMTGFSEELLQMLPGSAFLEAMQAVATHGANMPEMVLKLMQKLSSQSGPLLDLDAAIEAPRSQEKVRVLLRESEVEKFVPASYQKALMSILSTDMLPAKSMEGLAELMKTLDYNHLEKKAGDVIYEIIRGMPVEERGEGIRSNLMGLASHHLMNGDFQSLEKTCRIIIDEGGELESAALFDPGFIQEVLDAASLLGRDRFQNIRAIICTIGQPFVEPMMERLFNEENRSMRRLWFDCLSDLGELVRVAALERLDDERWFVVRNLVIMLRAFNDQEVQRQVRRLVNHPHPRVRKEAMKNLLSYGDPAIDKVLIKDLESDDPEIKLVAVQVSEMSKDPEVVNRLLNIVDSGGIREYGLDIKKAAVQALAAIGDPGSLPKLKEIIDSVRLLHPGKHTQLKIAIIRALPKFPDNSTVRLLEEIAATGGKTLAPEAADALKSMSGYTP